MVEFVENRCQKCGIGNLENTCLCIDCISKAFKKDKEGGIDEEKNGRGD